MKFRSRTGVAAASVVLVVGLALSGCAKGGDKGGSEGGTEGGSSSAAASLVNRAADDMRNVTGVHLNLVTKGDVPNMAVDKLEGDVANKPQSVATGSATMKLGQSTVDAKFVYVDGHLYSDVGDPGGKYTDFGDGASIYNVSTLLDDKSGLANLLTNLKDPKEDGTEEINGVKTTKVTGTSSSSDIAKLAGSRLSPEQEQTVPTTVWIATDAPNHLVQAQVAPTNDASVTLTLSEWGKQVTAAKPAQ